MSGHARQKNDISEAFRRAGFDSLTIIQKKAIPKILQKRDCVVIAPTGSGKTECAIMPIFSLIAPNDDHTIQQIRCLYITPLRALNRDVFGRIMKYAKHFGISVQIRHGDTTATVKKRIAQSPPDVLITTPESAVVLLSQEKMLKALKSLQWVVIDELHELISNERGSQLSLTLERLQANSTYDITRIGLSATVGNPVIAAKMLVGTHRRYLIISDTSVRRYDIDISYQNGDITDTARAIISYIRDDNTTSPILLFTNSRGEAEMLATTLKHHTDIPIEMHHGSLSKQVRQETESALRRGQRGIVVCTSSLELGIDIGDVDLVIHYGSPRQVSKLIQRIGRSRHHIGMSARGLIIVDNPDDEMEAMAILERVKRNDIESQRPHICPLDVLAHHMVGMLYQNGTMRVSQIFEMAQRAYPFKDITISQITDTLNILDQNYIVRFDKNTMAYGIASRSYRYHYENLTTIPDILRFRVFDSATKKTVGTLDQRFVGDHEPGDVFVLRATRWRIIHVDQNSQQVIVEPSHNHDTMIPHWEGETIPVGLRTAQGVGRMRPDISLQCQRTFDDETFGGIIPDSHTILCEYDRYSRTVIMHICAGTRINMTISALISAALSGQGRIQSRSDAYRIMIHGTGHITHDMILDTITGGYDIRDTVTAAIKGTHNLNWRIWQVARRFGAVRKDTIYEQKIARYLHSRYIDTPIVQEALRELYHDKYDIDGTISIMNNIRNGKISLVWRNVSNLSWLATPLLDHAARRYPSPSGVDPSIMETVKERLQQTQHRLICARCGRWQQVMKTHQITESPVCPKCFSRQITATYYTDYDLADIIRKKSEGKKITDSENKRYRRAWKIASLIETFGQNAIIALSGFGVGADTGARILRNMIDRNHLFRQIYEAERQYVMTRGYWDR